MLDREIEVKSQRSLLKIHQQNLIKVWLLKSQI